MSEDLLHEYSVPASVTLINIDLLSKSALFEKEKKKKEKIKNHQQELVGIKIHSLLPVFADR